MHTLTDEEYKEYLELKGFWKADKSVDDKIIIIKELTQHVNKELIEIVGDKVPMSKASNIIIEKNFKIKELKEENERLNISSNKTEDKLKQSQEENKRLRERSQELVDMLIENSDALNWNECNRVSEIKQLLNKEL